MTKLQWCRNNALDALKNLDVSNYKQLDAIYTSMGNQRKWYDEDNKRYIKEQFFYQGKH